jgi:deoxyribodipyrimidine photo-lyase
VFIRRWLPELAPVPAVFLHEPWRLDPLQQHQLGWQLGHDYPAPIVEPEAAARQARQRIHARRQELGFAALADAIQERHGSRRAGLPASGRRARRQPVPASGQLQLDLEC